MHREPLLQLLDKYVPSSAREEATRQEIIDFVRSEPRCFSRDCPQGHITGSAWLLNEEGTGAFLLLHRKLQLWLQPGGHCDGDPDVLGVAVREAQEESGILAVEPLQPGIFDLDVHWFPESKEMPAHKHFDVRFLLRATGEVALNKEEAKAYRWVEKDMVLENADESVVRMQKKWAML